jgi:hypothetical protein
MQQTPRSGERPEPLFYCFFALYWYQYSRDPYCSNVYTVPHLDSQCNSLRDRERRITPWVVCTVLSRMAFVLENTTILQYSAVHTPR